MSAQTTDESGIGAPFDRRPYPALTEVLSDAARTPIEGAAPVLRRLEDEEASLLAEQQRLGARTVNLERRGHWYGTWVELPEEIDPRARLPRPSRQRQRIEEARPLVWRGALDETLRDWRNELFQSERLGERLAHGEGGAQLNLRRFVASKIGQRNSGFSLEAEDDVPLADPERDLARVSVRATDLPLEAPRLWAKLGRLSNFDGDRSLRLRLGFGREVEDDDDADPALLQRSARLAALLFPERALVTKSKPLTTALEQLFGARLLCSQDIAYWNRPQGGARFHHDAFLDSGDAQRGVCFAQLTGNTAWAVLSITDLARRALEFRADLRSGEAPWVVEALADSGALAALDQLAEDRLALLQELALPGQGRLGALIDQGPEFLGFLADHGHGAILDPGDLILLPNHGRLATCMHSVFCASEGENHALSLALFEAARNPR